jgi:hypothetical protein
MRIDYTGALIATAEGAISFAMLGGIPLAQQMAKEGCMSLCPLGTAFWGA